MLSQVYKGKAEGALGQTDTRRRRPGTEAEVGGTWTPAKGHLAALEAKRGRGDPPKAPRELGYSCEGMNFCCFRPLSLL